jgi:hypothetical protein
MKGTLVPKKEKYTPAQRTIQPAFAVRSWSLLGHRPSVFYKISINFRIPKLRGAWVQIVGPGSWDKAKLINKVLTVKNKDFTVRLSWLQKGKTSIKFVSGYKFVVKPKDLKEIY